MIDLSHYARTNGLILLKQGAVYEVQEEYGSSTGEDSLTRRNTDLVAYSGVWGVGASYSIYTLGVSVRGLASRMTCI